MLLYVRYSIDNEAIGQTVLINSLSICLLISTENDQINQSGKAGRNSMVALTWWLRQNPFRFLYLSLFSLFSLAPATRK